MPTPSLILVPARFKTGKLYTPVATTSGGVVLGASGDFNVTRATTATRVNASGLIESVASGIPRLDYYTSGGTAGCPALLVEPSAQNLVLQSQTLDVSGTWVRENGALVSANATGTTAPDGLNTAEILTLVSGAANALYQTIAMTSGTTYTASIFLKNIALTSGQTFIFSTANQEATINQINCTVDLDNGTITSAAVGAGVTVSNVALDNYGNGWYRARFTFSFAVGGTAARLRIRQGSVVGYNTAFYVWGAQLETSSVATSYIPTTTGTGSRSADVISVTGAVSGSIGQTEGTLYAEFVLSNLVGDRTVFEIGADNSNKIRIRVNGSTISANAVVSGTTVGAVSFSSQPLGVYKLAYAYKQNDFQAYLNGNAGTPVASGNVPTNMSIVGLGTRIVSGGSDFFNDRIRAAALYTTRLSNAELAALTAP